MEFMDIFNDDAFNMISMTAAINNVDHVPGRAGSLVFQGVSEGIRTTVATFEMKDETLTLIRNVPRGAPAEKEDRDKATLRAVAIPHFPLEDTINADEVAGVREFGSTDQLRTVQTVVNNQLRKIGLRHDLTLEHLRLGALKGVVLNKDGDVLVDLFELFNVLAEDEDGNTTPGVYGPKTFNFDLEDYSTADSFDDYVRSKVTAVKRWVMRNAKTALPSGFRVHMLCGDNFFDKLTEHPSVRDTYKNTSEQERRLGATFEFGAFEYGGVTFENYRGTDDDETVAVDTDTALGFLTGVPAIYAEYFAPANFVETVNTVGLPRYAKLAPDLKYNRFVEIHTQQNPLPVCLRPRTLIRAISTASISEGSD
jgi:hypothetical protein